MTAYSITFDLNTALTKRMDASNEDRKKGNDGTTADWTLAEALWQRIKDFDGITKCFIERFQIEVHYLPQVLTDEQVFEIVQDCVEWAAQQEGFFPLRGDKTPEATHYQPAVAESTSKAVVVEFGTNLVAYPVNASGTYDEKFFLRTTQVFANELANMDGIIGCKVSLTWARLTFDTRITNYDAVVLHTFDVIRLSGQDDALFPYVDDTAKLKLQFRQIDT